MQEITLEGYRARLPTGCGGPLVLGTRGSYGVEQLRIVRGEGWSGLAVTATFVQPSGSVRMLVPEDGVIDVPAEVTAEALPWSAPGKLVFAGVQDGVQQITTDLMYSVLDHADIDGSDPQPPAPDLVQQILAAAQRAVNTADSVRRDADAGRFDGAQGAPGATPQLTIGTVTTLAPDAKATAEIAGTPEAPVLNLGIPQGAPGDAGSAGVADDAEVLEMIDEVFGASAPPEGAEIASDEEVSEMFAEVFAPR